MNVTDTIEPGGVFAEFFEPLESWATWRIFLSALSGLGMDEDEFEVYRKHTGRSSVPIVSERRGWSLGVEPEVSRRSTHLCLPSVLSAIRLPGAG